MIDAGAFAVAFSAGMLATINPCGFAMLPAYLSYFLGLEDRSTSATAGVARALRVGLTMSAGFMVVFLALGIPLSRFSSSIQEHLSWVTMVIGVALVVLGVAMLRGFEPVLRLPKLEKGTGSRETASIFLFGVSYAVSSLSCSIGVFVAVVASTFSRQDFGTGLVGFFAYALGMALVLMVLTLAIALARQSLVQRMRRALPYVNRTAGGLLVLAGSYLAYYGWYEHQVTSAGRDPGGFASVVSHWNGDLSDWVSHADPLRIGIVLGAVVTVALLVAAAVSPGPRSARPPTTQRPAPPEPVTDPTASVPVGELRREPERLDSSRLRGGP